LPPASRCRLTRSRTPRIDQALRRGADRHQLADRVWEDLRQCRSDPRRYPSSSDPGGPQPDSNRYPPLTRKQPPVVPRAGASLRGDAQAGLGRAWRGKRWLVRSPCLQLERLVASGFRGPGFRALQGPRSRRRDARTPMKAGLRRPSRAGASSTPDGVTAAVRLLRSATGSADARSAARVPSSGWDVAGLLSRWVGWWPSHRSLNGTAAATSDPSAHRTAPPLRDCCPRGSVSSRRVGGAPSRRQ
jgi:hypothetical protein